MSGEATDIVSFEVPGPPRGKGRPRAAKRGAHIVLYTDSKTQSYEAQVKWFAAAAMKGKPPMDGALHVLLVAAFPIPASWSAKKRLAASQRKIKPTGKPDLDNVMKVIDGCNGILWRDDAQITSAMVKKIYSETPYLFIEVSAA